MVFSISVKLTFDSRSTFERNELLDSNESRQIVKRVEDNRTSLLTLRDTTSQCTEISIVTENLSLLDQDFDFDGEVLTSDVYRAAWRANLRKDAIRTGIMPQRGGNIREMMPEDVTEEYEGSLKAQAELGDTWGLSSRVSYPLIDLQASPAEIETPFEDSKTSTDQKRGNRQESQGASLEIQIETSVHQVVVDSSTPEPLALLPMNTGPVARRGTRREKGGSWLRNLKRSNTQILNAWNSVIVPRNQPIQHHSLYRAPAPPETGYTKVLFLGSGESGKSTLLKATKLLFEGPYSRDERNSFREIVFSNTLQSMRVILEEMESLKIPLDNHAMEYHVQTIFMQSAEIEERDLPPEVGTAIAALWGDAGVREAFERSREYILFDSVPL